jgi:hypothetical protein
MMFRFSALVALLMVVVTGTPARSASDAAAEMDRYVHDDIVRFEHNKPNDDFSVRELTFYAHYLLAVNQNTAKAEAAMRRAFAVQDMNPASKEYGAFPWDIQGLNHSDANSVEFTLESVGPILLRYSEKLTPDFKRYAVEHVRAGLIAVRRHKVAVTYTNIYLMKIENLLLLGEWSHDDEAVKQGGDMLDQWLSSCRRNGIHEYASPTYSAVQLNCLCSAYLCTSHVELKPKLKIGLDFLYASMIANYFPGQQGLAGAHSRTYDFLFDNGGVDQHYLLLGLRKLAPFRGIFADSCGTYINYVEGGYTPSAELLSLPKLPQRTITETWGDQPGEDRYTFITPEFSAGSASGWYGPQDQQIAVQLAQNQTELASSPLPTISVCIDSMDAPYGKVLTMDRGGHNKPTHLRDSLAAVQHEGSILALLDISPGFTTDPVQSIATDILLPLRAQQIVLDGQPVSPDGERSLPAGLTSVVGIRQGNGAVAVRIFAADGLAGETPALAFRTDGAKWGAARLVAYHYHGESKTFDRPGGPIRAGVLIVAGRCETDAEFTALMDQVRNAEITSHSSGDKRHDWAVTTVVGGHSLEAGLSFKTGRPFLRRVDGQDYHPDVLTVNDRDLAAEILK